MRSDWASSVFRWFDVHGRHDLPWQHPRSAYAVWVSEIMLQQTTVSAVIPYFQRFMAALPDVRALADASEDELMALWSGLGYYARARNLHRAARIVVDEFGGQFPDQLDQIQALPGIGRSTAGAILAQAFDRPAPVLDGNVKRVLARHAGVAGWPGEASVLKRLWQEAESRLPAERPADYAQALMDLGASVCKRRAPACEHCPVSRDCVARRENLVAQIPASRPRKIRPAREHWYLLLIDDVGRILLHKRAPSGIWGGLWCLPEARHGRAEFEDWVDELDSDIEPLRHEFTHFSLTLRPVRGRGLRPRIEEESGLQWHTLESALALGLPQPIRRLIESHCT